jgi:hypothetical protein
MKYEILEQFALDIIKIIDYDLWKEVKSEAEDDDTVASIVSKLEDLIIALEDEDSVNEDFDS